MQELKAFIFFEIAGLIIILLALINFIFQYLIFVPKELRRCKIDELYKSRKNNVELKGLNYVYISKRWVFWTNIIYWPLSITFILIIKFIIL